MPKFRKKPVVIEAWQWVSFRSNKSDIYPMPPVPHGVLRLHGWWKTRWQVKTLEGWLNLSPGDYIIRGVQGEYYPCKPDIFEKTYDAVED